MPLTSYDKKVLSSIFMIEQEGVIDFLDNIVEGSDILLEIDDHTEDVTFKLQKLYRKGKTVKEIMYYINFIITEFLSTYGDLSEAEVQSEDLYFMDHVNFEWTKNIIKEAKQLEEDINKSKKLKTWEHSYKKEVESGVNIQELDESIKTLITKHLRNMKGAKMKKKKKKKYNTKKKIKKKS
jgi:hypothetical protein